MLNSLNKKVFQHLKSLTNFACGGLFSCVFSFTKCIPEAEILKKNPPAAGYCLTNLTYFAMHTACQSFLRIVEASSAPRNYIGRRQTAPAQFAKTVIPNDRSVFMQSQNIKELYKRGTQNVFTNTITYRKTFGHMLVACKSKETALNKVIYQKKQLQNPANPGFLISPPQAPKNFGGFFPPYFGPWGEKTLFSPHFPDPGGKIEKAVSPHNGGGHIHLFRS